MVFLAMQLNCVKSLVENCHACFALRGLLSSTTPSMVEAMSCQPECDMMRMACSGFTSTLAMLHSGLRMLTGVVTHFWMPQRAAA